MRDIAGAYSHLLERGAKPHQPVKEVDGDIKVAAVVNPFGNVIGLIQNPHFTPIGLNWATGAERRSLAPVPSSTRAAGSPPPVSTRLNS